jgi:hypothetical protein
VNRFVKVAVLGRARLPLASHADATKIVVYVVILEAITLSAEVCKQPPLEREKRSHRVDPSLLQT